MIGSRLITTVTSLSLVVVSALTVAACGGGSRTTATPAATATVGGPSAGLHVANSGIGKIVVDAQGRTLYLFKADSGTMSACDGACAAAWPPLLAHDNPSVAGGVNPSLLSTIQRPGGTRQLTYHGHPLYLFVHDSKPGEVNGEGVTAFGAPWYALSPAGNQVSGSAFGSGTVAGPPGGSGY